MTEKPYKPTRALECIEELNSLGYSINFSDDRWNSIFGMLVALAKEVEELRSMVGKE